MFDRSTWSESSGVSDAALSGAEGTFFSFSFWLVQALALTGRRKEAKELFEALLNYASPLGLYGEEMARAIGSHLGNFPQALTHAALIQAMPALRDTPDRRDLETASA